MKLKSNDLTELILDICECSEQCNNFVAEFEDKHIDEISELESDLRSELHHAKGNLESAIMQLQSARDMLEKFEKEGGETMNKLSPCPLCGGNPEITSWYDKYEDNVYSVYCENCNLASYYGTDGKITYSENNAREAWEALVAKFPPIMRLKNGDNILTRHGGDIETVLSTDLVRVRIYTQDIYGDTNTVAPEDVVKWPWELEVKGGSHE